MISPVVVDQPAPGIWRARCLAGPCTPHLLATGTRRHAEQAADRHLKALAPVIERLTKKGPA
ncbi:hypothetical protein [Actinomadura hibisca]|uniref:hypothetical protein n=1 Tax=Actinomadura hibisca TaxID=68565 RepID=UPI00082CFABA|nr:hypothetical protein [Actinomadura hibisca]